MNAFSESLYAELEERLDVIRALHIDPLPNAEEAIKTIIPFIERLKKFFASHAFCDELEEIHFFKVIKPKFLSCLIFHNELYSIESNRPMGGDNSLREFLLQKLHKLKSFSEENNEFCKYYRTGNDCFDAVYFVRRAPNVRLSIDSTYFLFDQSFSTMHDYNVARILANDRIEMYLSKELERLEQKSSVIKPARSLKWTGSKAALVELVYALHTEGVFNDGGCDLKEVAAFFEAVFGAELGQYHRVFLEIRGRKSERTKFLNSMREKLVRRMEEADEA
ncbi:MAG: tetracycline regulation of excision, RteC [Flavobacterium sp.]|nr:MAG: tetracycline regulation of excision, RteC [Flavobacterium sp.]